MITAVENEKGGVGKTSTCMHLSGALAKLGQTVLLIDFDPQASLTKGLLGPAATDALPVEDTIAGVLAGLANGRLGVRPLAELARPSGIDGVGIIPGSKGLIAFDNPAPESIPGDFLRRFKGWLRQSRADQLLIDGTPRLTGLAWIAMAVADGLVVPVQPEDYGAQGILPVQEFLGRVRARVNPDLALYGYLITLIMAREADHRDFAHDLREAYGSEVFPTAMPRAVAFRNALAERSPVSHSEPKSPAAMAMDRIAGELLARQVAAVVLRRREEVARG